MRKAGGLVNPAVSMMPTVSPSSGYYASLEGGRSVWLVDFDIAATVTESKEGGAGAKIAVASIFSAGAGGKVGAMSETTSRIRFKVPIALPVDSETLAAMKREREAEDAKVRAHNKGPS